jgi:hypothetical protein
MPWYPVEDWKLRTPHTEMRKFGWGWVFFAGVIAPIKTYLDKGQGFMPVFNFIIDKGNKIEKSGSKMKAYE